MGLSSWEEYKIKDLSNIKKDIKFIPITANINILVNYEKKIIIEVYINTVINTIKKSQLFDKFEAQFQEEFEVKLYNKTRLIFDMLVKRYIKRKTLYLSYTHYIRDLLSTYDIIEANLVITPIIKGSTILFGKSKDTKFDVTDY